MATFRKLQSGKHYAEVRIKGVRTSKAFLTKAEARAWADEQERLAGKYGTRLPSKTLGDAFERYAKEVSPTHKGERWEVTRLKKLGRDNIAYIQLSQIRSEDIQDWISRQTISAGSVNRELCIIQAVLRKCRKPWKWMHEDIFKDIEKPQNPKGRDRLISDQEIATIIAALVYIEGQPVTTKMQIAAVGFLFAIETAMRQGEIWGMRWQDVHLTRRFVHLPDTKNGTKRDVPLSARAVALLEMMPRDGDRVFNTNQASTFGMFRLILKRTNIRNLRFHDTRHTAITRLARKLGVLELARMTGHKDLKSLQIYYNETAEEIAKRLA